MAKAKLPGWVLILAGVFSYVPDWKGRFDFWVAAAKEMEGHLAVLAPIVASPFFGAALIISGLAYVIFVDEEDRSITRHPFFIRAGWIASTGCLVLVLFVAGTGYFEIRVHEAAASLIITDRIIEKDGQSEFSRSIAGKEYLFNSPIIFRAVDTPEANGYAYQIMNMVHNAHLPVYSQSPYFLIPLPMTAIGSGVRGVFFQISDPRNPPPQVLALKQAFIAAGIETDFADNITLSPRSYAVTIGLK